MPTPIRLDVSQLVPGKGKPSRECTDDELVEALCSGNYDARRAYFAAVGWREGAHYCSADEGYTRKTAIPILRTAERHS